MYVAFGKLYKNRFLQENRYVSCNDQWTGAEKRRRNVGLKPTNPKKIIQNSENNYTKIRKEMKRKHKVKIQCVLKN